MKNSVILIISLFFVIISCKPTKYTDLDDGLYANMETNKGSILLKLEFEKAPITVANFVSLAEGTNTIVTDSLKGKPYYNGLVFHRVIKDFMIQGGDPTATGSGDPGYKFKDEFPKDSTNQLLLKHDKSGILSMANSGPATNGSQFFITHKETSWLDGKHTIFGNVITGQVVVDSIAQNDTIKNVEIIKIGKEAKRFNASEEFSNYFEGYQEELLLKEERLQKVMDAKLASFNESLEKATTLTSGLKITITETLNGEFPPKGVKVKVNYAGYFTDGKLFDTSYKEVASAYEVYNGVKDDQGGYMPLTTIYGPDARVVAGFKEGLQKMRIGDKALLFIPSHLGWGTEGAGNVIPPNADLFFELELVAIVKSNNK